MKDQVGMTLQDAGNGMLGKSEEIWINKRPVIKLLYLQLDFWKN